MGDYAQSFGQTDPASLISQARQFYPDSPSLAPMSNQQLVGQARGMVQPMFQSAINAIASQINNRSRLGTNAIQGYGQNYINSLPAIQNQVQGIYDSAKGEQASTNDALANFIRNQGAQASTDLGAQAAAAGQTNAGANQVAAVGAGASGATMAYGGSTLERLIGQGAAEQSYTAQLPAFARAEQTQTLGNFLADQNNTLRDQTNQLQQQLPQTIQSTYQNLLDRELQKTGLNQAQQGRRADFYNAGLSRNVESRALGAQIYQGQQQLNQDQSQFETTQKFQNQQLEFEKAKAGIVSGTSWDKKLQSMSENLAATADQLAQGSRTKSGLAIPGSSLSYGKIRGRLNALIKGKFGGDVPPRLLKFYVDQALMAAGWKRPGQAAATDPYAGIFGSLQPDPRLLQPPNADQAAQTLFPDAGFGIGGLFSGGQSGGGSIYPPGLWGTAAGG